jgi:integrase
MHALQYTKAAVQEDRMTYRELMTAYLTHLQGRPGYEKTYRVARQWVLQQETTPTRRQILGRLLEKGKGDFMPGSQQANKELVFQRAAFRWGIYHEVWAGGDPTVGIKKFKTARRKRIAKFQEVGAILKEFGFAKTPTEIRNRALFGIALLTGCRPSEIRTAPVGSIVPYGAGGCWNKGETKTGETHEIPIPVQAMAWLNDWLTIRPSESPWLFPGQDSQEPLSEDSMRKQWAMLCQDLRIDGLWNYDLRRTLASYLSNELKYSDSQIRAILNHTDGSALGHYCHVSFDAMVPIVQGYADFLFSLQGKDHHHETIIRLASHRESLSLCPAVQA